MQLKYKFPTLNLLRLVIYKLYRKTSTHVNGQDISWLAKLKKNPDKTNTMENIVVQSKYRLPQQKVDAMIAHKYRKPYKSFIKRGLN
jgi:hypothetical protein